MTTPRPMIIDEMGVVEAIHYLVAEEEATKRMSPSTTMFVSTAGRPCSKSCVSHRQESLINARHRAGVQDAEVRLA